GSRRKLHTAKKVIPCFIRKQFAQITGNDEKSGSIYEKMPVFLTITPVYDSFCRSTAGSVEEGQHPSIGIGAGLPDLPSGSRRLKPGQVVDSSRDRCQTIFAICRVRARFSGEIALLFYIYALI